MDNEQTEEGLAADLLRAAVERIEVLEAECKGYRIAFDVLEDECRQHREHSKQQAQKLRESRESLVPSPP